MNKSQLVNFDLERNADKFGRWGSKRKRDSVDVDLLFSEAPPQNAEETVQHGNALASTGNYPLGTDDCFNVGIAGGCGPKCFVFREGRCEYPEGIGD